jgi:hypothetical protein
VPTEGCCLSRVRRAGFPDVPPSCSRTTILEAPVDPLTGASSLPRGRHVPPPRVHFFTRSGMRYLQTLPVPPAINTLVANARDLAQAMRKLASRPRSRSNMTPSRTCQAYCPTFSVHCPKPHQLCEVAARLLRSASRGRQSLRVPRIS